MIRIAIGADHGGYDLKETVLNALSSEFEFIDCGTNSKESVNYPVYGKAVAEKVANNEVNYGVVICTSGEGIMIAANKVKGIRCGIGYNDEVTKLMRQHNDANVIAFGAKFMSADEVIHRIKLFVSTEFEGGRHQPRVDQIKEIEK